MPGERNVSRQTFTITFDENVQLDDAFNKVVVSPVQIQTPQVSSSGKHVTVELRDTIQPNHTYTIDFGDAIKDLNEGNILDGFALAFSTGADLDTLAISGIVLQADNLEPAQGMMVVAYDNIADSAIRTIAPARMARTNQHGQFTIRNLAAGSYRVYALNDLNRDFHWDRSEDVAFLDYNVTPTVQNIQVTDTLYDHEGADSLVTRSGYRLLPNDVLLTWFNENYQAQYLKDYTRVDRRRATINLGAPADSLARVSVVGGPRDGWDSDRWALKSVNATRDSLTFWITDTLLMATDSLRLAVSYQKPDSLERMAWTTDTLRFFYREPKTKKKRIEIPDTVAPKIDILKMTLSGAVPQDVYRPLGLAFDQPIAHIDTAAIAFEMMVDSTWTPQPLTIEPDPADTLLRRIIRADWIPGNKYRLVADSASIVSVYGEHIPRFTTEFNVKQLEEYANLTFRVTGADSTAMVVLLSGSDQPVKSVPVVDGKAVFKYLNPGTYYARMFFDTNGDGKWTTGTLDSIQPEEVAYYPKKLELKRNWDVDQAWNIYELAIDAQKPYALLKNKPKLKSGEKAPTDGSEDEEDEDALLGGSRYGTSSRSGSSSFGTSGLGSGGIRTATDRR